MNHFEVLSRFCDVCVCYHYSPKACVEKAWSAQAALLSNRHTVPAALSVHRMPSVAMMEPEQSESTARTRYSESSSPVEHRRMSDACPTASLYGNHSNQMTRSPTFTLIALPKQTLKKSFKELFRCSESSFVSKQEMRSPLVVERHPHSTISYGNIFNPPQDFRPTVLKAHFQQFKQTINENTETQTDQNCNTKCAVNKSAFSPIWMNPVVRKLPIRVDTTSTQTPIKWASSLQPRLFREDVVSVTKLSPFVETKPTLSVIPFSEISLLKGQVSRDAGVNTESKFVPETSGAPQVLEEEYFVEIEDIGTDLNDFRSKLATTLDRLQVEGVLVDCTQGLKNTTQSNHGHSSAGAYPTSSDSVAELEPNDHRYDMIIEEKQRIVFNNEIFQD